MFETIMWWGFGIGLFCQCWVALTSGGEKTPGQELMDTRANLQAELLVRELLTDMQDWRIKVQESLQSFSQEPALTPVDMLREQLTMSIEHLEGRIEETLNKAGEGALSEQDGENFYQLLGAYRGLSEAIIEYAATAEGIRWDQWRESRF